MAITLDEKRNIYEYWFDRPTDPPLPPDPDPSPSIAYLLFIILTLLKSVDSETEVTVVTLLEQINVMGRTDRKTGR